LFIRGEFGIHVMFAARTGASITLKTLTRRAVDVQSVGEKRARQVER